MSDYVFENVSVVVRHRPDYSLETGPDGNKVNVELPGKYEVGALVNGAFVPLAVIGKNRLDRKVQAASEAAPQDQGSTGEPQPQQTGSGGTTPAPVQEPAQGQ